jgi:predicted TIM-barrel fold metal-dependent hydrolase
MNVQTAVAPRAETKLSIIDCDVHPRIRSFDDLRPHLSKRWWEHLTTYGPRYRHGYATSFPYPKASPLATRRDAWPEGGGTPGSDLSLMQRQLLDLYGVEFGILNPLSPGQGYTNPEFSAAVCSAANDWQIEAFTSRDSRLKASILVPYDDGPLSRAEIEKRAGAPDFAQVLLLSRTAEPLGKRRYWPIYETAVEVGLPVGIHVFGYGGWPITNGGWPSFYIEEMTEHSASTQAVIASLIFEGVFDNWPALKLVIIESGFAWIPALGWRLDKIWERNRSELQHVKHPPSYYLKTNIWVTTQPMEEPLEAAQLIDVMEWIGWDRILFASDYPHWDFDDPRFSLPVRIAPDKRRAILSENARAVYGFA